MCGFRSTRGRPSASREHGFCPNVQPVGGISEPHHSRRTCRISLITSLLQPILSTLATHHVEPTPAVRGFFEAAFPSPLFSRPVRPAELPGWAHQPRGCGMCAVCAELDEFLASETEIGRSIYPGHKKVYHLESLLDPLRFSVETSQPWRTYMTTIRKLKRE